MLFCKKLIKDLEGYGFKINPYNWCVANKVVNREQQTILWHVDDLKSSNMDSKIQDEFIQWIRDTCGSIGEVKVTRGKIHEYLGMKLDHSVQGQVSIDMVDHVKTMVEGFPKEHLQGKVASPWNKNLFKVHKKSPKLDTAKVCLPAREQDPTLVQPLPT